MPPLVSVIIPTYNRAEFIGQTVQGVLHQTYTNIEVIVVDDGSTDRTREVLEQYSGQIAYVYQERSERSEARNRGFRHSKGDYVAFLDSDDLWLPMKIEKQVQVLNENPSVGVVYTGVEFIDANGDSYNGEIHWDMPVRQSLYEDLMFHNVITGTTSSVMVRRICLDKVGLFDEFMNTCEDLDLYRRLAQYYDFYRIDLPLVKFRIHSGNTQCDDSAMAKGWEMTINKIARDTPPEFHYYRNEAIIRLLSKTASLYRRDRRFNRFCLFCAKSLFDRPNWVFRFGFWKDLVGLSLKKIVQ